MSDDFVFYSTDVQIPDYDPDDEFGLEKDLLRIVLGGAAKARASRIKIEPSLDGVWMYTCVANMWSCSDSDSIPDRLVENLLKLCHAIDDGREIFLLRGQQIIQAIEFSTNEFGECAVLTLSPEIGK